MGRRQKALDLFEQAYQAQMSGDLNEASRLYKASLTCHPTAEAYTFLGWTYSLQGNLEGAIALCRRAIEVDPELGNPYTDMGAYLVQLDRYREATVWLKRAANARRYASYSSAHYNLGQLYEHLGDNPRALASYRLALRECPDCDQIRQAWLRLICQTN